MLEDKDNIDFSKYIGSGYSMNGCFLILKEGTDVCGPCSLYNTEPCSPTVYCEYNKNRVTL